MEIDLFCPAQKLFVVLHKTTIMIQVMNIQLKSSVSYAIQEHLWNGVSLLWDNLERRFDSEHVIQIHQLGAKVPAGGCLHIVCHDGATRSSLWPEPDERKVYYIPRLHQKN
jgi:hypothetical protein